MKVIEINLSPREIQDILKGRVVKHKEGGKTRIICTKETAKKIIGKSKKRAKELGLI